MSIRSIWPSTTQSVIPSGPFDGVTRKQFALPDGNGTHSVDAASAAFSGVIPKNTSSIPTVVTLEEFVKAVVSRTEEGVGASSGSGVDVGNGVGDGGGGLVATGTGVDVGFGEATVVVVVSSVSLDSTDALSSLPPPQDASSMMMPIASALVRRSLDKKGETFLGTLQR